MSTVLIVGASRGIGYETVRLALKAGHSVRAMARSVSTVRLLLRAGPMAGATLAV
jgi:NAD(P)-dependent dehydrogenase (short-subunit alcohol dehydrogenase family)